MSNTSSHHSKPFSVMRDPVHGDVLLTAEELALIDTPQFQRLRGVKQLGTAYLVFPSAVHTRFEHSIGTLHVTRQLIASVNRNFELDPRNHLRIADEEARVICLAALVHDVTHMPFGHNIEDQSGLIARHDSAERYERTLGAHTALGRRLDEFGVREDVMAVLAPRPGGREVPPYWTQLTSDTICSDILDYLARDAYFTGLRLSVDERLGSYFQIERKSGNLYIDLSKRELLREDILSEIVRMLEARYYFSERVYYHHAKVIAGAMIARAVESVLGAGLIEDDALFDRTDDSLLSLLVERAEAGEPELAARVRRLVEGVRQRVLYKRAAVFPRYENEDAQRQLVTRFFARDAFAARRAAEERIREAAAFATGRDVDVIVYCPAARMQLKEAATHVLWPGEREPRPLGEYADRVPRLADLEQSYRNLWKFYVLADTDDRGTLAVIQKVALEEFEGARNAYRVG
ncbi:deoxyguanosinetriphosphate triphosphohydrolase-like protein [Planctomycetes bacterium Pla163]|uniref:Deoxyguanosinetriphosphate triphosphohydrolase-like protein n=1 Tax=Rohdeia mirabilis TaxID=2528008 RepID=A0A518D2E8_9BACT|nr:deoxyguanosinetriphosphate triphosphohydrolase-like protein [Planctomycetes bacterium Pla163]